MNKHIINDFYQELGLAEVQEFLARRKEKGGVPYVVLKEGFLEACRQKDVELVWFLKEQVKPKLHERGMFHLILGTDGIALEKAFEIFPTYMSMNHEIFFQEFVKNGQVSKSQTVLPLCKSISPVSVYVFLIQSSHKDNQDMFEEMIEKLVIPKQTMFHDFGLILKQANEIQFDQLLDKTKDTQWFLDQQHLFASFCLDLIDNSYLNNSLFDKAKKFAPFITRDQFEKAYQEKRDLYYRFKGGFSQAIFGSSQSQDKSHTYNSEAQEILRLIDKHALQQEIDIVIDQKEGGTKTSPRKRM